MTSRRWKRSARTRRHEQEHDQGRPFRGEARPDVETCEPPRPKHGEGQGDRQHARADERREASRGSTAGSCAPPAPPATAPTARLRRLPRRYRSLRRRAGRRRAREIDMAHHRFLLAMWRAGATSHPSWVWPGGWCARPHRPRPRRSHHRGQRRRRGCTFSPWVRAPHRRALVPEQDPIKDWETDQSPRPPAAGPRPLHRRARRRLRGRHGEAIAAFHPDVVVPDAFLRRHRGGPGGVASRGAARANIWIAPTPHPAMGPASLRPSTFLGPGRVAVLRTMTNRVLTAASRPATGAAAHGLEPLTSFYDQALVPAHPRPSPAPPSTTSSGVPENVRYVGPRPGRPRLGRPSSDPWPREKTAPSRPGGVELDHQNQGPLLRRVVEAPHLPAVRARAHRGQCSIATR